MAEHDSNFYVCDTVMATFKLYRFLVTFAKLRKVTVIFVVTVSTSSLRMEQLGFQYTEFNEI